MKPPRLRLPPLVTIPGPGPRPVLAVSGLGRCGTSLAMAMAQAGGVPVRAQQRWSFETDEVLRLPGDAAWVGAAAGQAVKFLDPHRNSPPAGPAYRVLWLDRNLEQQARSQAKLLRVLGGVPVPRGAWRQLAEMLEEEVPLALEAWQRVGAVVRRVRFEGILAFPPGAAQAMAEAFDVPLDQAAAAAVVRPRSGRCAVGFQDLRLQGGA